MSDHLLVAMTERTDRNLWSKKPS